MRKRKAKAATSHHKTKRAIGGCIRRRDAAREAEIGRALLKQNPVLDRLVSTPGQPLGSVLCMFAASVGLPWVDVRCALLEFLKSATGSSQHEQPTVDEVAGEFINLEPVMLNGVPHWKMSDGHLMRPWPCFVELYVDPGNGLLCRYEESSATTSKGDAT